MKLMSIVGTRPNMVKIAPLCHYLDGLADESIQHDLVHTGQHYDDALSGRFFRELGIPEPSIRLATGSGSHAQQTARIITALEPVLVQERPDWVIVVGDVNSTLAATLVAAKLGLRIAHIEAGLRSFDRTMPEEINRIVTDRLADLLLTPSADADDNLVREGVDAERIKRVGNIMIDTLIHQLERARESGVLERLELEAGDYVYVTLHRPVNVDDPVMLVRIFDTLKKLSQRISIVFPVHPRTRANLRHYRITVTQTPRLKLVEPMSYHDSIKLMESARLVLTDSGGIQEETTYLGIPCLTLRPNTERPVTITHGTNQLTDIDTLHENMNAIMNGNGKSGNIPDYWDGQTAKRIVENLLDFYAKKTISKPDIDYRMSMGCTS